MSHARLVDVKEWIDQRPISRYQWLILVLCFVVIMFDGYDTAAMGFIAPALIEDWGINPVIMGPILGAAMLGVAIGALIAGPLSDKFGRKRVLLYSVALFSSFGLLSAFMKTPFEMASVRFIAGLGLGAVMPNCVTLVSEYMPERRRGLMITIMYSGFNIGSGLGGFVAAGLISAFGWESVLAAGGIIPLLLLPLLIKILPESAMYMVVSKTSQERIRDTLSYLGAKFDGSTTLTLQIPIIAKKAVVLQLFSSGYARGTLVLWVTYFMGLFVIYLLNGWLPTILRNGGISLERAAIVAGLFQLGGTLGGLLVGAGMDRFQAKYVIGCSYTFGSICLLIQGFVATTPDVLALLVFFAGLCINGVQTGLQAFSPAFYPTEMRATGVCWMHGIGRGGAIVSSTLGGILVGIFPGQSAIFILLSLPALLAAFTITQHRRAQVSYQLSGVRPDDIPALSRNLNEP